MPNSDVNDRRIERTLFFAAFFSFAYFYQGADQSTAARFDLMRAIIERHTLWIDGYCGYNTADIITYGGHYYSVKAPGGSLTGLLQWLLFTTVLSPVAANHEALYWALTTWLTIVFSTSAIVALLCVVMYRCARFAGATRDRSVALALVLAVATIVFPYATEMTGEPIAGACAFISFYLLATYRDDGDAGRSLMAGFLAGWAVLCDFPAIVIAVPLALFALFRMRNLRHAGAFALGAGAVATLLLAYNRGAFGSFFFLSYQAYKMAGNSQFPEQAAGFVGVTYPKAGILWKILCDPRRGLFFCNPVLILTLPALGFFALRRRLRAEFVVTLCAVVLMVLFNASYGESIVSWGGGTAVGPRQIVAAIPFMVFTLAFLPAGWNWLFGLLAVVSAFAMLAATAIEPHFPYEYANPLREFIWPAYLRGDFAYNRDAYFGGSAIMDESAAFNLGGILGLPGRARLWPLVLVWIGAATLLMRRLEIGPRGSRRRFATLAGAIVLAIALAGVPMLGALTARNPVAAGAHGLLGRYYRGLPPYRFPPHIVRVDPQIDFNDVAELGALPVPSFVSWSGKLIAPRAGIYVFGIVVDDSGWLFIDGKAVIPDPGDQTWRFGSGYVYLTAGAHRIEAGERNLVGDAAMHLSWRPPGQRGAIVPSAVLVPDAAEAAVTQ